MKRASAAAGLLVLLCLPGTALAADWGAGFNANWGGGLTIDEPSRVGTSGSVAIWGEAAKVGPDEDLSGRLILGVDAVWPGWNAFDSIRTTLIPHLSLGADMAAGDRSEFLLSVGIATKFRLGTPTIAQANRIGVRVGTGLELPSSDFSVFGWFHAGLGYGLEMWCAILRTPDEEAELAAGIQLRFSVETR